MYIISFHHQCFQEEGMFALREVVFKCICLLSTRYHEFSFSIIFNIYVSVFLVYPPLFAKFSSTTSRRSLRSRNTSFTSLRSPSLIDLSAPVPSLSTVSPTSLSVLILLRFLFQDSSLPKQVFFITSFHLESSVFLLGR